MSDNFPTRKEIRLKQYTYSTPNAYFITICTKDRRKLLWANVGAAIGRPQDVILSSYGKIVEHTIQTIPIKYPSISIDQYTIMPDHIHLLLQIHTNENGRPMAAPTISTVINQMKGAATKQAGFPLWQKGFYDHVIRNDSDYLDAWNYIQGNPMKWEEDQLHY